jgi:ketosteroid isomerase-like protein
MSTQRNKAIARRYREELWHGQLDAADEIFDADCTFEIFDPVTPDLGRGPAAARQLINVYRAGFPDLRFTVEEVVAEDDRVVIRWSGTATFAGDLLGIAATGRSGTGTGTDWYRLRDGRIIEFRSHWDTLGTLQRIGAMPGAESVAT